LEECIPARGSVEQSVDLKLLTALLNQFLGQQDEENRRLFVLRYWYLCPVREIAEQNGMGLSKVKMRLMRMREELRKRLEKEGYSIS
ncbi:MAG: RNA polymerase subunit sigma-70, partial [Lachnospiraceae bacterium]|nr:RNA polymerase subunit sigma-70 [Lachnospiraceae bacterium]